MVHISNFAYHLLYTPTNDPENFTSLPLVYAEYGRSTFSAQASKKSLYTGNCNRFFRSDAIDFKFGMLTRIHAFYHRANFQVNRMTTTEDTDGFGTGEQIRHRRAKSQTV